MAEAKAEKKGEEKREDARSDREREKAAQVSKAAAVLSFVDIWMDGYNDIFSDFDPAPFSKRAISADFVDEVMRRTSEEHDEDITVRMSVPQAMRSQKAEAIIKKRLREFFLLKKKKYDHFVENERKKGYIYFIGGFLLLSSFVALEALLAEHTVVKLLAAVMAPFGWFGVWEGVSHILEGPEKYSTKKEFYTKLAKAKFEFFSEEELTQIVRQAEESKAPPQITQAAVQAAISQLQQEEAQKAAQGEKKEEQKK
ncbi:MAG: hypothetical protein QXH30_02360 [Candidatus Bilamarchaeaceae archaeon]